MNMLGCFKKHAQPNLPSRLNLHEVTASHIEKVIDTLLDEGRLSNATIKRVVQSMSVPLKEATRKKWVAHNPMDGVEVIANTYQQRGIYTVSEIQKILDYLYIKGTVGVTERGCGQKVGLSMMQDQDSCDTQEGSFPPKTS